MGGLIQTSRSAWRLKRLSPPFAGADPLRGDQGRHLIVSAAAFHLAGFAARSFSMLPVPALTKNLASHERALGYLLRRDLSLLRDHIIQWHSDASHDDDSVAARLLDENDEFSPEDAAVLALTTTYYRGLGLADTGLLFGNRDAQGDPVTVQWRPTRQRLATLDWSSRSNSGRLAFLDGEKPFVPRFVEQSPPLKKRKKPFPIDEGEFCICATNAFARDGHTVLVYSPQKSQVEPAAREFRHMHDQGYLTNVKPPAAGHLAVALAIGREWLAGCGKSTLRLRFSPLLYDFVTQGRAFGGFRR